MQKYSVSQELPHAREHILACLSSAPSNERIICAAARMAKASGSLFTALFVETPDFDVASPQDKQRLSDNRRLAERLGAEVETVVGDDIPYQIAEYARLSGITTIVLGQSAAARSRLPGRPALTDQLIAYAPQIDIHIIPDQNTDTVYRPKKAENHNLASIFKNTAKSVAILFAATLLGLFFEHIGFTDTNIILVYILGVLLISVATSRLIYSLIASVASVFMFNYFFTHPRFTLAAYDSGYPVTFIIMFLTAFITGTAAIRYKEQAGQSAKVAYRTRILFDTGKLLSHAEDRGEILHALSMQVVKLLGRDVVIYDGFGGSLGAAALYPSRAGQVYNEEAERPVACWVFAHNHFAGATTDTFPHAAYIYFALRVNDRVYGVLGIEARDNPLDASAHGILLSILGEGALALENKKNAQEKEEAAILAKNEKLRANLLRTISHDLRTPLTTISGNASALMSNEDSFDRQTRQQLYADIYSDSMWLYKLVENLLSATRFEDGQMTLRLSTELLGEIVEEALEHVRAASHPLSLIGSDDLLLVRADARLLMQVIVNIVDNAVKYTPSGSPITVTLRREGDFACVDIADSGKGISGEEKTHIFDKFYCGAQENGIADNRRSLGLGLYLCRAIIHAHGGTITVRDNQPHGAVFSFALPLEEVTIHEALSDSGR